MDPLRDWMTLSGYRLPPGTHAGAVAAAVAANAANASAAAAAAASTAAAIKPELNRSNSAMSDHGNGGGGGGGGPQPPPETPSPELWSSGGGIGSAGMNRSLFTVKMSQLDERRLPDDGTPQNKMNETKAKDNETNFRGIRKHFYTPFLQGQRAARIRAPARTGTPRRQRPDRRARQESPLKDPLKVGRQTKSNKDGGR